MKELTVFTPTYNRAYTLGRLYESLCRQSNKNFEWLVVDDGSKDGTEELIKSWQSEEKISIRYIYQENGGKRRRVPDSWDTGGKIPKRLCRTASFLMNVIRP